jgi:hypothetical protein
MPHDRNAEKTQESGRRTPATDHAVARAVRESGLVEAHDAEMRSRQAAMDRLTASLRDDGSIERHDAVMALREETVEAIARGYRQSGAIEGHDRLLAARAQVLRRVATRIRRSPWALSTARRSTSRRAALRPTLGRLRNAFRRSAPARAARRSGILRQFRRAARPGRCRAPSPDDDPGPPAACGSRRARDGARRLGRGA